MPNSSCLPDSNRDCSSRLRAHGYQRNRGDDEPERFEIMQVQLVTTITGAISSEDGSDSNNTWGISRSDSEEDTARGISEKVEVKYQATEAR